MIASAASYAYYKSGQKSCTLIKKVILAKESYIEITQKIRKVFTEIYRPELKKSREERRKLQARSSEYEKCVSAFQNTMKVILDEASKRVIKEYGINNKILEDSVNYFDSDSEMKEYGEKLVQPLPFEPSEVRLTKEETKKILHFYLARSKESETDCPDLDDYLVMNSQIEDEIYRNFRVEIEDVNHAYEIYKKDLEEIVEPLKTQTSYILASADDSFEI